MENEILVDGKRYRLVEERRQPQRPQFDAVCSDCKQKCQVPFKPREGWQVRCPDCYAKFRGQA